MILALRPLVTAIPITARERHDNVLVRIPVVMRIGQNNVGGPCLYPVSVRWAGERRFLLSRGNQCRDFETGEVALANNHVRRPISEYSFLSEIAPKGLSSNNEEAA